MATFVKSEFTTTDLTAPKISVYLASDAFDRADGALGTTPIGNKAWALTKSGPDATNWAIVGNKAKVSGNVGVALATVSVPVQNVTVSATYESFTGGPLVGLAFRGNATSILCFYRQQSPAGTWVIQRFTYSGNSFTQLATGVAAPFSAGEKLEVRCSGTTFTCYVNGTQVAQITDAANGSNYGLMAFSNSAPNIGQLDNFIVSE